MNHADCNLNGVDDALDISLGTSTMNNVPDECEPDGDFDGVTDDCDLCPGKNDVIDDDGVPNGCDLCEGFDDAADADYDGVPDGCDAAPVFDPGPQVNSLVSLEVASLVPVEVRFEQSLPCFVNIGVPLNPALPDDPVIQAVGFMDVYRDFYGLSGFLTIST